MRPEELYLDPDELLTALKDRAAVRSDPTPAGRRHLPAPEALDLDHAPEQAAERLRDKPGRTLLAADTAGRRELIAANLKRYGVSRGWWNRGPHSPAATTGWRWPCCRFPAAASLPDEGITILTESELFPGHTRTRRRDRKSGQDPESIVRSLADLQPGALVVHLEHGIGRYQGLEVLEVGDTHGEFLTLEYAEGDKLYVPVTDLHLVSRYTGADPDAVTLNRLSSDKWKKTRRKAAEKGTRRGRRPAQRAGPASSPPRPRVLVR